MSENEDGNPTFEDVMRAARAWHYTAVRELVDGAIEDLKRHAKTTRHPISDEDDAREWLTQYVDEATDGHNHVIYTAKAGMVVAASDNDGAYEEEIGEPAPSVEAQACMAMRRDAWELLEARSDEWEVWPPEIEVDDDVEEVSP